MQLGEIARQLGCELRGDGTIEIERLMPIEEAGPGDLTFVANPRYRAHLATTRAAAVIVRRDEQDVNSPTLRAEDPYLTFARAIDLFHRPAPAWDGVHPTAQVHPTARLGSDCHIGPFAVVGEGAVIGDRARLDPHVVIYPEVRIGDDFRAFAHAIVRERVEIGHRVILQAGCVVGGDGFGYVLGGDGTIRKITQAGNVVLGDDVEIGANTTIDRAAIGSTRIGPLSKVDNLVMIAHGCQIGFGSAIAAQTGLSGSTQVGNFVRLGGQVGSAGHLKIGDGASVAAQSGLHGDIAAGDTVGGTPAIGVKDWRRQVAALGRLPELLRRFRRLEATVERLTGGSGS